MARMSLPKTREGVTVRFTVDAFKGYLTINEIDGRPVEVFIRIAKEGSTVSGLLNALCIAISIGLRSGAEVMDYVRSFKDMRFTPSGYGDLGDGETQVIVHSFVDAIAKILEHRYGSEDGAA